MKKWIKRISIVTMVLAMTLCTTLTAFAYEGEAAVTDETVMQDAVEGVDETTVSETDAETEPTEQTEEIPYSYIINEDGSVIITLNEAVTEEIKKTGTVVTANGGRLNVRTGAGMSNEVIDQLRPGEEVIVIGSEGDWYEVIVPEKTGFVHSDYLEVLETAQQNNNIDSALLAMIMQLMTNGVNTDIDTENDGSFTPSGNMTLNDDYLQIEAEATEDTPQQDKQFITLQSKNGNVFYLVIDRNGDEENVYFLNLVDEADLLALMEDTVCQHYGIETSEYSFGYIAGWSEGKELKELRSSMEVIRREADSMITEIDGHMEDIRREREQEAEIATEVNTPFIASYYVIEDLDTGEAPVYHKFDDLDAALQVYFAFPNDKTKALGIESTNENAQKVDLMECINGIDHTLYYYLHTDGWNNPEVVVASERAFAAMQDHDVTVAYQNDNGFFVIQQTDAGFDYTFYNDHFELLDGGVLDEPDLTIREAIDSILADEGLSIEDCTVVSYEWLMVKVEAVEMEQIEQIGRKADVPKISMDEVKALLAVSHNQEADLFEASKTAFPNMDGSTLYDNLYGAAVEKLREDADTLDVVELFGKEALFTNGRVTKNALPEGLYTYDLRGSDNDPGQPITLEPMVLVNHAASVIVSEKIPIPESGVVPLGEDMSFTGDSITMEQFYDSVNPGKGENVYHKDASDIAEKAVRFYLGNPDTMDHLGDRRENILSALTDKLSETYLSVGNTAKPKEQTIPPMSKLTFAQAKEQNKVEEWRASRKATENCSGEFDEKFGIAYHERRMPEFLTEMTEKYGMERCMVVLASTIQLADHDGRYYPSTKADAAKIEIPGANTEDYSKDIRMSYRVNCHPVMVNSAFRVLQQMQQEQSQDKQAVTEKKSVVEQDAKAAKPSLLNRLHDKQKEANNMTKQNPAKTQDKKRGAEI